MCVFREDEYPKNVDKDLTLHHKELYVYVMEVPLDPFIGAHTGGRRTDATTYP